MLTYRLIIQIEIGWAGCRPKSVVGRELIFKLFATFYCALVPANAPGIQKMTSYSDDSAQQTSRVVILAAGEEGRLLFELPRETITTFCPLCHSKEDLCRRTELRQEGTRTRDSLNL